MSIRILVVCEGSTEEGFVNEVLAPHLGQLGIDIRGTRLLTSPGQKGGVPSWEGTRRQLDRLCKSRSATHITTLFDLYGLPTSFPGRDLPAKGDPVVWARALEQQIEQDLGHPQFKAHLQVHEFEAMLFSTAEGFQRYALPTVAEDLMLQASRFPTPEHINDSPQTAPSKRIEKAFPQYRKVSLGLLIAREISLPNIRSRCLHFDSWLTWLESLA